MGTTINPSGTPVIVSPTLGGPTDIHSAPLLLDQFTTNVSAPLPPERIAEPGPGKLTLLAIPTGAAFSVASNKLVSARPTAGQSYANYGALLKEVVPRVPGIAVYGVLNCSIPSGISFGLVAPTPVLGNSATAAYNFGGSISVSDEGTLMALGALTASVDYQLCVVLRQAGQFFFIRGGTQYPNWTLLWVGNTEINANLFALLSNFNSAATLDDWTVKRLTGNWWDDYANATNFLPLVTSGDVAIADADGTQYITWTPVASETLDIQVRRVDDNNCWIVRCAQAGGTIKLFEKTAGTETERDTGKTQTWTVGNSYRIGIRTQAANILSIVNKVVKHNYASAAFQQTATGAKVSGAVALANWEFWAWAWAGTTLDTLAPLTTPVSTAENPNRVVWITDLHCGETGGLGQLKKHEAKSFAEHLNGLRPALVVNTGDNGNMFGEDSIDFQQNFVTRLRVPHYFVRGNHDEDEDYTTEVATSFVEFDTIFPATPYHFTADWVAPQLRFIVPHTYIIHAPDALVGFAAIDAAEYNWAAAEIDALPVGWKAIVMTHFPADPAFGANITATFGGTAWLAILAARSSKILFYGHGHRHSVPTTTTLSGITHVNGLCGSYWTGSNNGGFMMLDYNSSANTITLQARHGKSIIAGGTGYFSRIPHSLWTPLVFAL